MKSFYKYPSSKWFCFFLPHFIAIYIFKINLTYNGTVFPAAKVNPLELTFFPDPVEALAKLEYTSSVTGEDNYKIQKGIENHQTYWLVDLSITQIQVWMILIR